MEIADPDVCLRYTARAYEGVQIGPSPAWLRQRLTAAGQRPISNIVDISNYVMLDLRAAHPHLRPGSHPGSEGDRAPRSRRRDDGHPGRGGAHLHLRHGADRRPRGPDRDRRGDGRADLRGVGHHHPGAGGGGHVRGPERAAHLKGAEPALGGLDPVREAAAPRERPGRPAPDRAADGGTVRRPAGARADRCLSRPARAAAWWSCAWSASTACWARPFARTRWWAGSRRWGSRASAAMARWR